MKNLDVPVKELYCGGCRKNVVPIHQIRLAADECGQTTDCISWDCSACGRDNFTSDDVSILSAEILEI